MHDPPMRRSLLALLAALLCETSAAGADPALERAVRLLEAGPPLQSQLR